MIERAKREKIRVSCETCPHYFTFSLKDIEDNFDPNLKVNPPLGREEDKEAIKRALSKDIIDCIATDHAPHTYLEKEVTFYEASFGIIGLEFAFSLSLNLVREGYLELKDLSRKLSYAPSKILGLDDRGEIREGKRADLVIVDLEKDWRVEIKDIVSKSKNTPLIGKTLKGKVEYTIYKGRVVYKI